MKHDEIREGINTLVFATPRPKWVSYFKSLMPAGQQLETTPLDMAAARQHHMDRIRKARDRALEALDSPWMQAIEAGDQEAAAEIAQVKQALRDIPQTFNLSGAQTPAALMALWPPQIPK